ncbi:hypothetical protein GE09DRAFT_1067613 [Coniochaeta sp. 2T2.1]|nr:hypothetical protein GE09DRAFT_1067613 [Coniochaeta sp. 2T2.1]
MDPCYQQISAQIAALTTGNKAMNIRIQKLQQGMTTLNKQPEKESKPGAYEPVEVTETANSLDRDVQGLKKAVGELSIEVKEQKATINKLAAPSDFIRLSTVLQQNDHPSRLLTRPTSKTGAVNNANFDRLVRAVTAATQINMTTKLDALTQKVDELQREVELLKKTIGTMKNERVTKTESTIDSLRRDLSELQKKVVAPEHLDKKDVKTTELYQATYGEALDVEGQENDEDGENSL